MYCSLNLRYINYGELRCNSVIISLKTMNFKLQLVFLLKDNVSRWTFLHVPVHMITFGDFQFDWRKCNPIKSSKVNGDGKKHRSVPEVFSRGFGLRPKMCWPSANTESSRRAREKPLVPRVARGACRLVLSLHYDVIILLAQTI